MRYLGWLLRLVVWSGVGVAALLVSLFALLGSQSGSAWVVRQLGEAARSAGVEVAIGATSGVLLRRFELSDLGLNLDGTRVAVRRLRIDWRPAALLHRELHLVALLAEGVRLAIPPGDDAEPSAPIEVPTFAPPMRIRLDRFAFDELVIERPDGGLQIGPAALAATLDGDGLALSELQLAGPGWRLDGAVGLAGTAPHPLQGQLSARLGEAITGADVGEVALQADLSGQLLQPGLAVRLQAPLAATLDAGFDLRGLTPRFDVEAAWDRAAWPPRGPAALTTHGVHLTLQGTADAYRLHLAGRLQAPDLPAAELEAEAQGDLEGLRLQPLRVVLPEGRLIAEGRVGWAEMPSWQLDLDAEHLNPALFAPEWPGRIDAAVQIEGRLAPEAATPAMHLRVEHLGGELRGYPVSAEGGIDWDAGRLHAQGLQLASGPNRLSLDGQVDQAVDLGFDIDAPELATLYPGLGGRFQAAGRLGGSAQRPSLDAKLTGEGLRFSGYATQRLDLDLAWDGERGTARLDARDTDLSGQRLDRLQADLKGVLAEHRLTVRAEGPQAAVAVDAAGGWSGQAWDGSLDRLTLREPVLGEWRLGAPVGLTVAPDRLRSGPLCLRQGEAALCAEGGWQAAAGFDLRGTLGGLAIGPLVRRADAQIAVDGALAAEFSAKGTPDSPELRFALRPTAGSLRTTATDPPLVLAYRNASISGRFADDRGQAELGFDLGDTGHAQGWVTPGPEQAGGRPLSGTLTAAFPDLGLVAGFVPALDTVTGRLQLGATLGGTLQQPRLSGELAVRDASARVTAAGIQIEAIALTVSGDDELPLQVHGEAQSGKGRIALDGTVDLAAAGGPRVDLALIGDRFQVVRLPEAEAWATPDLRLRGQETLHLSGSLKIPSARLEIKELPAGTVAVSDDEIVVVEGAQPEPEAGSTRAAALTAKVRVELGDQVRFKGFGLDTGLRGALDAAVDARGTTVDGRIEMSGGRYKAYGQDLEIELGRLLFAGPPDNPDVDLRAMRLSRDETVKAYLGLSGPLKKPRARVYSDPALPEAQALAYLLTGRELDQAGRQDGANIAAAAVSLGVARGEPLLQQLSDRFGLDDLRVDTGDNALEDSSLVLGKYLNPDLYLGYSQGLFNPEGAVLLRLRLSKRFELESRTGDQQSVDLLYRLEHN